MSCAVRALALLAWALVAAGVLATAWTGEIGWAGAAALTAVVAGALWALARQLTAEEAGQ